MRHGARGGKSSIDVTLAVTRDEFDTASRLVHRCYLRRGYVKPSPDGRHASPYLAMPSTAVFIARASFLLAAGPRPADFGLTITNGARGVTRSRRTGQMNNCHAEPNPSGTTSQTFSTD